MSFDGLRLYRERNGITQAEMAAAIYTETDVYEKMEKAKRYNDICLLPITTKMVYKIHDITGESVISILAFPDSEEEEEERQREKRKRERERAKQRAGAAAAGVTHGEN